MSIATTALSPTDFIHFATEGVAEFEKSESLLEDRVYKELVPQGNTATFNITGNVDKVAKTRNLNSRMAADQVNRNQQTATLVEKYHKIEHTDFDLFASQNGIRRAMEECTYVLKRDVDDIIRTALDGATTNTITGVASLNSVNQAIVKLHEANAGGGPDNLTALVSPSFMGLMRQIDAFNNADYIDLKPYTGDFSEAYRFMGVTFIVDPEVAGVGTSSAKCYFFHRNAIGYACNTGSIMYKAGYYEPENLHYAYASVYHGAVLLQETGVVEFTHDDTQLT